MYNPLQQAHEAGKNTTKTEYSFEATRFGFLFHSLMQCQLCTLYLHYFYVDFLKLRF